MKKISLFILIFVCTISFGQTIPTTYGDLIQFQNDAGNLVSENFSGGPQLGMNTCGNTISNNGDTCFPVGEIEEDFTITTTNGEPLKLFNIGFYPNQTVELISASSSSESVVISFSKPVFAVGLVLYSNQDAFVEFLAYDTNGNIIYNTVSYTDINNEYFEGITYAEPIGRIEIKGDNNNDALIGSLLFTAQNGSGGPSVCGETNTSNAFENGISYDAPSEYASANDLTVASGEEFELSQIVYNSFHENGETITSVDVNYYAGAGGLPGVLIGSQTGIVPTSQTFLGNDFGVSISEIVLDLDPIILAGATDINTTYWIELANGISSGGGILAWEMSSNSINGNPMVSHELTDDIRTVFNQSLEGVYTWNGSCSALGTADNSIQDFSYYPNPTNSILNLRASKNIESITLYNIVGQKVMSREIGDVTSEIYIGSLAAGTYLMKVFIDGKTDTFKVIKQ